MDRKMDALAILKVRGSSSLSEVARQLGVSKQGALRHLEALQEQGHMTEVAEGPNGSLELRHCNCPIQDVAARTGHPCQHELDLYRRLLKAKVERSSWVGAGDTSCTYQITANEGKRIG